ncbi:MAG: hypothetical protein HWD61_15150 [Parachlamydiaceae bacterium]|nr:MAG: hypothetical protein HWD61_15150 [Parachlamydiaceae bacterium]
MQSPPNNETFEEMIYKRSDGKIPSPSSGGWHVYKPGEHVRNLRLSPWSGNTDRNVEFNNWSKRVPQEDVLLVQSSSNTTPSLLWFLPGIKIIIN